MRKQLVFSPSFSKEGTEKVGIGGGDNRRAADAGLCPYVSEHPADISILSFMGYLKGKSAWISALRCGQEGRA